MKRRLVFLLSVLVLSLGSEASLAQGYPNRPIRLIVGFPPGGGTDVVARILQAKLSDNLGQPIVIENRPGATGTVAAAMVAKSPADGYTIMMGHVSVNAIAPSLFASLQYDVIKDFAPIILTASVPHFIVVHPTFPVNSLRDLIARVKMEPGKYTFPSAGNGSTPHLAGEMFKVMAGVELVHVPYKGTGQSMQDLLGGQHKLAFDTMPASSPHVRAGRLRALAVSSARRLPEYPDIPTAEEAGVPGYRISTWYGLFAPAGTPPDTVKRLHAETLRAMQSPEVLPKLREVGVDDTVTRTPEEFAAIVRADTARYAQVVKDARLKLD